jgi:hypothetical protein
MTARAKPEPGVGIFWLFGGKLILYTTPPSQAEVYPPVRSRGENPS